MYEFSVIISLKIHKLLRQRGSAIVRGPCDSSVDILSTTAQIYKKVEMVLYDRPPQAQEVK